MNFKPQSQNGQLAQPWGPRADPGTGMARGGHAAPRANATTELLSCWSSPLEWFFNMWLVNNLGPRHTS